ncbi:unnamed protein product [Cuscuta epithymum]|uniref:Putative gamma-glutamylcyclotransferase n=1 Tax=Cuscuta epithymum TaxID=186058 RepID=A0AAV0C030_9ASTE|nr:unnamed protein product [Cuscuta epithymum]
MVNAQSTCNVFVYNSLQEDDVVRVLLNRVPPSSPATLHHYQRFNIKGRVYPAILPAERSKVNGSLLWGITLPELEILDNFKDVEYERRNVDVSLMDSSEVFQAYTYVWDNEADPDLYGEWDFEEWKDLHMEDFIRMTTGFVKEKEQLESRTRVQTYESFYKQEDDH